MRVKTTKDFRLPKQMKTIIALTKGTNEHRNAWKNMYIKAQVAYNKAKAAKFKENNKGDEE